MAKLKISVPRGTNDILPKDTPVWQYIEEKARYIFDVFGYKEIRTPLYEEIALFARSLGDSSEVVNKQLLTLSSDNKAYQPYQIHTSEIMEIWQFKLNLCIGQYDEDELNPSNILSLMRSVGIELKDLKNRVSNLEIN